MKNFSMKLKKRLTLHKSEPFFFDDYYLLTGRITVNVEPFP